MIGLIGAGHLAGYLLEGLHRSGRTTEVLVADCRFERAQALAQRWGAQAVRDNQALVDAADLVVLAVRPVDVAAACGPLAFRAEQVVASVVAGLPLAALAPAVAPAQAVRVMPISSAALNRSPTLVFPGQPAVAALFALLGQVHELPDEASFTAASVISAFYGWVYALAGETVAWAQRQGVPAAVARPLVLETIRSTADMALARPDEAIGDLLAQLATPGGITEHGLEALCRHGGIEAWETALDAVLERMRAQASRHT
jgi:pyrroline-5-carboxylate reductase